jgi:hypothetical protein
MSIEAMKQALEALERADKINGYANNKKAINTLRQAIAEAEKQEPVAFRNINTGEFCTGGFLRKDWAKWQPLYAAPVHAVDMSQERVDETAKNRHEWVGLTDGEMQEAMEYWSDSLRSSYGGAESASEEYVDMVLTWRYIEAKLKEKNNGMLQSGL